MNILHLSSEFPPQQVFGLGRFVRDLAAEQVRQGHRVIVITNNMGGSDADVMMDGARVLRVDYPNPPKPDRIAGCVMIFNILLLRRAVDLGQIELQGLDVVCSHDWLTAAAGAALAERLRRPHVCTFHDTIVGKRLDRDLDEDDQFIYDVEKWATEAATHIIANSEATKQELIRRYAATPSRISVVPCAVAPKRFNIEDNPVRIAAFRQMLAGGCRSLVLCVSRLDREKGVHVLLKAFERLRNRTDVALIIAGKTSDNSASVLAELAASLGLNPDSIFVGYVDDPVLSYLYRAADVLVCPSLYEPFGMVAIEAMLHGTAVVVSDTGGLAGVVEHGVTGLKVPPGDHERLCEAIAGLLASDRARSDMGAAGRASVLANRTWTQACVHTTGVYRDASAIMAHRSVEVPPAGRPESVSEGSVIITSGSHAEGSQDAADAVAVSDADYKAFPITTKDIQTRHIVRAFRIAAVCLRWSNVVPHSLEVFHWSGALGASVLGNQMSPGQIRYSPMRPKGGYSGTFEEAIQLWASDRCLDKDVTAASKKGATESDAVFSEDAVSIADPERFRCIFADSDEAFGVLSLSRGGTEGITAMKRLVTSAESIGLRLRLLVVASGVNASSIAVAVHENDGQVLAIEDLHVEILRRIVRTADLYVEDSGIGHSPVLRHDALANRVSVLVEPSGNGGLSSDPRVHVVDLESGEDLATLLEAFCNQQPLRKFRSRDLLANPVRATVTVGTLTVHEDSQKRQSTGHFVLMNDWGIGDELLLSGVARELRRARPTLQIWIRSRFGFRFPQYADEPNPSASAAGIEVIYQNPSMYGPTHHAPFPGHLVQQMLDKFAHDTGITVKADDFRPELRGTDGHARSERAVILHARGNPALPSKDWGVARWEALCGLLDRRGLEIHQVGALEEPLLPFAVDHRGQPVADLQDLFVRCAAVVCVPGLLMHLSAATRTPAVVIYGGREHPAIDGYPEHLHLCSEPLHCRGRWGCHLGAGVLCIHDMKCMRHISPELVAFKTLQMLGARSQ